MTNWSRSAQQEKDAVQFAQIIIPVGERLGDKVRRGREHLTKSYPATSVLIEDLTFKLPPGGIVGVIGPNGAGKSTLFKMITGEEKPDSGSISLGDTVTSGLRQSGPRRPHLDDKTNVWEEISGGAEVFYLGKKRR
jgi:ATPase subunit of ABC transporter with duplicated ATPase domains